MKKIKTLKTTRILACVLLGAFLLYLNSAEISYSKSLSPEKYIQEGKSLLEKGEYEQSLQKLAEAEAYFKSVQVKSKAERLSEIYFLQGLNFAKQGNEKISKAMFKRALHYSLDLEYDTSLMDGATKEIFTEAKIELEEEFSPEAMGMQGERYGKKGGSAGWIILAVIAIAAVGVLTYFLVKELTKKEEEPDTGTIQVNSTPTGAAISLDGQDTGKTTNATLTDVSAGTHTLKLVKQGYKVWEDTVTVNKGSTTHVNVTLEEEPKVGSIKVNSTPTGAAIWLDGQDTGKTTNATLNDVSVGNHTLKLVKERYQDWEDTVTVDEDATTTVNATLEVGAFTEDFNDGVADHWQKKGGTWQVDGGIYKFNDGGSLSGTHTPSYYNLGKFSNFTFEASCKRVAGSGSGLLGIAVRGGDNFNNYYAFVVGPTATDPRYVIWEIQGGSITDWIQSYTNHSGINSGSSWNTLKVKASGSNFEFYCNNNLLWSGSIAGAPSEGKIGLHVYTYGGDDECHFDNVSVDLGTTIISGMNKVRTKAPASPRPGDPVGRK